MVESVSERFGQFVRQRRTALGISVRQLAKELGVSAGYVSSFEAGSQAPPTIERLQKISAVLDIDADTLLELANRWSDLVARETESRPPMLLLFKAARTLTDAQISDLVASAKAIGASTKGK